MLPFAGTIFISAFLLFQVQPLISRVILPWYGGTPAVWTTCMLFFQAVLLAGYCYAHLIQSLPVKRQTVVHGVLLAFGILMFKIMPSDAWKPKSVDSPIPSILMLLAVNVGIPYLILSTTGPLLQAWFARKYPGTSPYRLYALSNVGSLLALVTYPAFFERYWTLSLQTWAWSGGFIVFAAFCAYTAWLVYRGSRDETEEQRLDRMFSTQSLEGSAARPPGKPRVPPPVPSVGDHFLWVMLAACGSTVFLATTNQMCEDIAVVPFLYILPLGLYLLSFILCFDSNWWYIRPIWGALLCAFAIGSVNIHAAGSDANIVSQVLVYCAFVFCGCMVCHGELARLKPAPEYLTAFFLLISCGGMIGGLFVGLFAPNFFDGYWEFPVTLVFVFFCFAAAMIRSSENVSFLHWVGYSVVVLVGFKMYLAAHDFIGGKETRDYLFRGRNFFGSLEVYSTDKGKAWEANTLIHGRIEHGFQWMAEDKKRWKTTYYGDESGIGLAINRHPRNFAKSNGQRELRIAMVGLGTGTTATYGEKGDVVNFYDINPMVERISKELFTYRDDCPGTCEVFLGDARIVMERQLLENQHQKYDVLGLDAFSSDAIPAHLLTLECMKIYEKHLRDPNEGVIAIHVSNRYLILERICRSLAKEMNMTPIKVENSRERDTGVYTSSWVLLTRNKKFIEDEAVLKGRIPWLKKEARLERVWTDDYYNLFDVVDWSKADEELGDFWVDAPEYVYEKVNDFANVLRKVLRRKEVTREEQKKAAEDLKENRRKDLAEKSNAEEEDDEQEGFENLKKKE